MKATLWIQYPSHDSQYGIDITDDDWQRYQSGTLEFSNISDLSLEGADEWSIEVVE